ncbi:SIR2 family NAD-dependent protein deacylase [Sphingobacterium hungaricum]|uniref:NAD-dependent protein deacylase n=1 Tax=Sphingobacterium hungaricum TaxID=2082723 RepID=A0A928UXZ6_9SPHI|nr:Sir2 family NAD-dependent protein deacetylase [Sphingobacterium hungaricum]MBE8715088.1 NAD-dependent protein deacylase [Sphingobacterium hungaricum]
MERLKIVVFTGAGISAESGLKTFRGTDGLWEGHRVEDVATPSAWQKDPELVQEFYNIRRAQCIQAKPNQAHIHLAELEDEFDVQIITQNIDDLHERAGSSRVLHLHGEIRKSQSSVDPLLVYPIQGDTLKMGELCSKGSQLRPHVVWFGEQVPNMPKAMQISMGADVFVVIGTSLQVYPAAQLVYEVSDACKIVVIDPQANLFDLPNGVIRISENATAGVKKLQNLLAK